MPKLIDANGNKLFEDVVLYNNNSNENISITIDLDKSVYEFKELIVITSNVFAIIPLAYDKKTYNVASAEVISETVIRTHVFTLEVNNDKNVTLNNSFIDHVFDADHNNMYGSPIIKVIGRY